MGGEGRVGVVHRRMLAIFRGRQLSTKRERPATFRDVGQFMRALVRERVGGLLGSAPQAASRLSNRK